MKVDVSGSRDGQPWPKRGEIFDVSDAEGEGLCSSGLAVPAAGSDGDVEKAVPEDDAEKRALTTETAPAVTPGAEATEQPAAEKKPTPAKKTAAKRTQAKPETESK
jgi:hypothetical protein